MIGKVFLSCVVGWALQVWLNISLILHNLMILMILCLASRYNGRNWNPNPWLNLFGKRILVVWWQPILKTIMMKTRTEVKQEIMIRGFNKIRKGQLAYRGVILKDQSMKHHSFQFRCSSSCAQLSEVTSRDVWTLWPVKLLVPVKIVNPVNRPCDTETK